MNAVDDTTKSLGEYATTEEHPSMLTVVVDTHPQAWEDLKSEITIREAMSSILVFLNGHLALNNSNKVAVIASHTSGARFLYPITTPNTNEQEGDRIVNGRTMYRQFREVNDVVLRQLDKLLAEDQVKASNQSSVSGALSLALTYINKTIENSQDTRMSSRILLLSVSGDIASQYISAMNCFFAAQKRKIPIDVCKLGGDTVFLQQACDATNGTYVPVKHPKGLVQYLMSAFTVEPNLRQHVNLGTQRDVDFRAACFVTKKVLDIGFVCSVCLCILSFVPEEICPHCETRYDPKDLAKLTRQPVVTRKKTKKKKTDTPGGTPGGTPAPR